MTLRDRLSRDVERAGLPLIPPPVVLVTEADLAPLPPLVRRYMRFMRVAGRPRDWSFRASFAGRFRLRPDGPWRPVEAWQYNTQPDLARLFLMRLRLGGVLPVVGRDTYLRGHGRMRIRLLDLVNVGDTTGPELDAGELVTFLNDAILFAPSMLLGPETRWSPVSEHRFDVTLTDRGHSVTARVVVDNEGAVTDFITTDRFVEDPYDRAHPLVQRRWSTPVEGWIAVDGHPIPTGGRAIWHLPQGEFCYVELNVVPGSLRYNVSPQG
jgi:hypothetical protein